MRDFRNLMVWQRAHTLTLAVYAATSSIPRTGYPGLCSQIRRSAAAVPTNLAEGCGHSSRREFARFIQMALASIVETEYHLQLCHDLVVMDADEAKRLIAECGEVRRMLAVLLSRIRAELDPERLRRAVHL